MATEAAFMLVPGKALKEVWSWDHQRHLAMEYINLHQATFLSFLHGCFLHQLLQRLYENREQDKYKGTLINSVTFA